MADKDHDIIEDSASGSVSQDVNGPEAVADSLLNGLTQVLAQLQSAKRDNFKTRSMIEFATDSFQTSSTQLTAEIADAVSQIRRIADVFMRQEDAYDQLAEERLRTAKLEAELESWKRFAVAYVRTLERTLAHPCLPDGYKDAAVKLFHDYRRLIAPLGIDIIAPGPGDPLDDRLHQAVRQEACASIAPMSVVRCVEWGIRSGDKVVERASVVITPRKQEGI